MDPVTIILVLLALVEAVFALIYLPLGHRGRVWLYVELLKKARCVSCGRVFGRPAAARAIREKDHDVRERAKTSLVSGGAPVGIHSCSIYAIRCERCGRYSAFRTVDHAVVPHDGDD